MLTMRRLAIVSAAAFTFLVVGASAVGQVLPRSPMLAYVTYRKDGATIDVMEWRTRQVTHVAPVKAFSRHSLFTWSADGRLAFLEFEDGAWEVCVWDEAAPIH